MRSMLRLGRLSRAFSTGQSKTITAAVAYDPTSPFRIEELQLRAPRDDEVMVKVKAAGICHTDLAVKQRDLCSFPIVLGHEGTGVVEAVGSRVSNLAVGDHVLMSFGSCGSCSHCLAAKPGYCYDHGEINFSGTHPDGSLSHSKESGEDIYGTFFRQSSFASHALATENNILKVEDKSLDLALLAPLGCGVQTGAGAVMNTFRGAPIGSSLAVMGCGSVGLSAVLAAEVAGYGRIVAVDLNPNRLEIASRLGATHTLQLTGKEEKDEVAEKIRDLTDGGVNYALDTTGNPHALRSAFDALRPLGVAGLIGGSTPGTEVKIDMLSMLAGKQVRGVIQGDSVIQTFIPTMIDLYKQGRFPFDSLITYYDGGLEDLNKACADATDASGAVVKPVLRL
mmetsp:Transcript_23965/g.26615  ORF Transcript_23965/g.26615 Transcript_23965/m.26615 type:complete len:394 (+) Transcript_23965:22-1203(+)